MARVQRRSRRVLRRVGHQRGAGPLHALPVTRPTVGSVPRHSAGRVVNEKSDPITVTCRLHVGYMLAGWVVNEKSDPITGVYFAVGSLATGGLAAPSLTGAGTLPDSAAVFVALYCLSGIPIFAMALGKVASEPHPSLDARDPHRRYVA